MEVSTGSRLARTAGFTSRPVIRTGTTCAARKARPRGRTGALIRCRPDGSRVETIAHGFENLVEVVFLPNGSIIGTLNWYQLPERGARDALIQILEGGQFPLHPLDALVPHPQFESVLPALT